MDMPKASLRKKGGGICEADDGGFSYEETYLFCQEKTPTRSAGAPFSKGALASLQNMRQAHGFFIVKEIRFFFSSTSTTQTVTTSPTDSSSEGWRTRRGSLEMCTSPS